MPAFVELRDRQHILLPSCLSPLVVVAYPIPEIRRYLLGLVHNNATITFCLRRCIEAEASILFVNHLFVFIVVDP